MDIQITGHQLEVTDAIEQLIENKLAKLPKHHANISHVHVVLELNNLQHTAKATIKVPGATIHAKGASDDMYKTIDDLAGKLITQLEKHKAKQ